MHILRLLTFSLTNLFAATEASTTSFSMVAHLSSLWLSRHYHDRLSYKLFRETRELCQSSLMPLRWSKFLFLSFSSLHHVQYSTPECLTSIYAFPFSFQVSVFLWSYCSTYARVLMWNMQLFELSRIFIPNDFNDFLFWEKIVLALSSEEQFNFD